MSVLRKVTRAGIYTLFRLALSVLCDMAGMKYSGIMCGFLLCVFIDKLVTLI